MSKRLSGYMAFFLMAALPMLYSCDLDERVDEHPTQDSIQINTDTLTTQNDTLDKKPPKPKPKPENKFEFRGGWEGSEVQTRIVFAINKGVIEGFCETERSSVIEYLHGEISADSTCIMVFTNGYGKPTGYRIEAKITPKSLRGVLFTFQGDEGVRFDFEKVDPFNPPVFVNDRAPAL